MTRVPAADLVATIDAWREQGADRFDPVRFRGIEALARRAAACSGQARTLLDQKVSMRLAAYIDTLEKAQDTPTARQKGVPERGPLAVLLEHIARQSASIGVGPAASDEVPGLGAPAELKTLRVFRSTWSKLSADQRLTQSLAKLPENAGPLNSQRLVHRSLMLMREQSPAYLDLFMSYVDALLWLDEVNGGSAATGKVVLIAENDRKRARGRRG